MYGVNASGTREVLTYTSKAFMPKRYRAVVVQGLRCQQQQQALSFVALEKGGGEVGFSTNARSA